MSTLIRAKVVFPKLFILNNEKKDFQKLKCVLLISR